MSFLSNLDLKRHVVAVSGRRNDKVVFRNIYELPKRWIVITAEIGGI